MPVLVVDCVTKSFGEKRVLTSGSLRAVAGEVRVIFGRNGSGKSTLMKIACGIDRAESGRVLLDNVVVDRPTLPWMARHGVFFMPDHDLLSSGLALRRVLEFTHQRFKQRSVDEAAHIARVTELLDRTPNTFSGGELRRAELAMALVRRPRVLLADEPFRGVAPVDHDAIARIFRSFANDQCAVVMTGHDVPVLLDLADHVTWCSSGTTCELGAPEAALQHESFQRDYLKPYSMTRTGKPNAGLHADSRAIPGPFRDR